MNAIERNNYISTNLSSAPKRSSTKRTLQQGFTDYIFGRMVNKEMANGSTCRNQLYVECSGQWLGLQLEKPDNVIVE
jgi:hypothetical protein